MRRPEAASVSTRYTRHEIPGNEWLTLPADVRRFRLFRLKTVLGDTHSAAGS